MGYDARACAMQVLIIPDKFKGTLAARPTAEAIARGWRRARPGDTLDLLPMSDGGDGFGEVLGRLLGANLQKVRTLNAAHQPCQVAWWWQPKTKTAVIESATAIGLAMLPPRKFHPFQLDTLGLGLMLKALRDRGARRLLVGIGGSATNDGGFGLARALGWQFFSREGKPIERWTGLSELSLIGSPEKPFEIEQLTVATDVKNPLLGPKGATRIYGPQKGLTARQLPFAELCLRRLTRVATRQLGRNCASAAGAGAAGGLGFGLVTFGGGQLVGGFELFAQQARLDQRLRQAQLVITGEGTLDHSSLMGKGVGRVACCCRELGVPCIGIAGTVALRPSLVRTFTAVHALTKLTSPRVAKSAPAAWLERLAHQVAKNWAG